MASSPRSSTGGPCSSSTCPSASPCSPPCFARSSSPPATSPGPRRLDVSGAVTLVTGLLALVFEVESTSSHGWTSARTLIAATTALVLLTTFVINERTVAAPIVPAGAVAVMSFVWAAIQQMALSIRAQAGRRRALDRAQLLHHRQVVACPPVLHDASVLNAVNVHVVNRELAPAGRQHADGWMFKYPGCVPLHVTR